MSSINTFDNNISGTYYLTTGQWTNAAGQNTDGINCLLEGTLILTPEGYKKIERLRINDTILTHDNLETKVIKVVKRRYLNNTDREDDNCLYYIEKDSIKENVPNETLFLSSDHEVLIDEIKYKPREKKLDLFKKANLYSYITYYHLKTEEICFFVANGVPAISYQEEVYPIDNLNKKNIAIILCYHDKKDLEIFKLNLPNILNMLDDNCYSFYIIRQINKKNINKGYLYNIAVDICHPNVESFIFWNTNMFTKTKIILNTIISGCMVKNNKDNFEKVLFFKKIDFFKVNGFGLDYYNNYHEKNIFERCKKHNLQLQKHDNKWTKLFEENNIITETEDNNNQDYIQNNGYDNIKYKMLKETKILDFSKDEYLDLVKKYDYKNDIFFENNKFNLNKFLKLIKELPTIRLFDVIIDF
jgi:hypothetical protein